MLTEGVIEAICGHIAEGWSMSEAARRCGIGIGTLGKWRERGQKKRSGLMRRLYDATEEARKKGREEVLMLMRRAATVGAEVAERITRFDPEGNVIERKETVRRTKDWRAGEAWLRHTGPPVTQRVEHSGQIDTGAEPQTVLVISPPRLDQIRARIAEKGEEHTALPPEVQ